MLNRWEGNRRYVYNATFSGMGGHQVYIIRSTLGSIFSLHPNNNSSSPLHKKVELKLKFNTKNDV